MLLRLEPPGLSQETTCKRPRFEVNLTAGHSNFYVLTFLRQTYIVCLAMMRTLSPLGLSLIE